MLIEAVETTAIRKHTVTIKRPQGPVVVDIWQPGRPITATPVLLVHGWGGSGGYWESTALALAEDVMVIVPDLPGTGRSQPVQGAQRMHDQVQAIIDVLDFLEIERVQINGHSMGGAMSLLLTDAQPERVERLVLTSLSFFKSEAQVRIYTTIMQAFKLTMGLRSDWMADVPGLPYMMAKRYFHQVPDDNHLLRQGLLDYLQLDAATATACANDAANPAIPEAGKRIPVPVLLIAARQDQVMPSENVEFSARMIPDCEVYWVEQCGHMPMIEKADEYMRVLRDFLIL